MKTYTEKIATSFQEHSLLRMKIIANLRVTLNVPDEEKVEYAVVKMERIRFSLALKMEWYISSSLESIHQEFGHTV